MISSLSDPLLGGFVEYPDKQKAILAYLGLKNLDDVIEYMKRWQNAPTAYKFALFLKDEGSSETAKVKTPEEEIPVAHENMPEGMSGRRALLSPPTEPRELGASEPTPPEGNVETPSTGEANPTPPTREIGAGAQPPPEETPEVAPGEERENLFK